MADALKNLIFQMEPMAALSTAHLSSVTLEKLTQGTLSVFAYPNDYGGFVYVGPPGENLPDEPDLYVIFELARRARLIWLKFDADAGVVEGLPIFDTDA